MLLGKNFASPHLLVWVATLLIVAALLYGCASIMHGTSQDVGVASKPTGATVTIDNKEFGKTPVVANLSRKNNHIIKIELVGFEPFETTIARSTSGWVWGNLVFGGLPGLVVDAITGGLYKLNPEQIEGVLTAKATGSIEGEDQLVITVVMRPDPSWERIGNLVPVR